MIYFHVLLITISIINVHVPWRHMLVGFWRSELIFFKAEGNIEEKLLLHVAIVAKCLDDKNWKKRHLNCFKLLDLTPLNVGKIFCGWIQKDHI